MTDTKTDQGVKLFVGQIHQMTEPELRKMFEPFGQVTDCLVLRDRVTNSLKGCGFITFAEKSSADAAIATLHDQVTVHETKKPLQVKYAGGNDSYSGGGSHAGGGQTQDIDDSKLFVGMLSKTTTQDQVRAIFSPYGAVAEVFIMKDPISGASKGCAFVKFENKSSAELAIQGLNDIYQDTGAPRALQVKFADSKKPAGSRGMGGFKAPPMTQPNYAQPVSPYTPISYQLPQAYSYANTNPSPLLNNLLATSSIPGATYGQQGSYGQGADMYSQQGYNAYGQYSQPTPAISYTPPQQSYQTTPGQGYGQQAAGYTPPTSSYTPPQTGYTPPTSYGGAGVSVTLPAKTSTMSSPASGPSSSGGRGPTGSNLFVYSIPEYYSDADMNSLFAPYGTVVSASVFRDKNTGLSKGFGFVSFDTAASADKAITSLNGFMLNGKRLKVQLKKGDGGPSGAGAGQRYAPY